MPAYQIAKHKGGMKTVLKRENKQQTKKKDDSQLHQHQTEDTYRCNKNNYVYKNINVNTFLVSGKY